jgi:hypothetical protein
MPMIGLFARYIHNAFTTASSHIRPCSSAPNDPGVTDSLATAEPEQKDRKQHQDEDFQGKNHAFALQQFSKLALLWLLWFAFCISIFHAVRRFKTF